MKFELALLIISTVGFVQGDSCWNPSDCNTGDLTKPVENSRTSKCWATKSDTINTSASQGQVPQYC